MIDASEHGRRRMNLRRREAAPISAPSCRTLRVVMSTKGQLLDLLRHGEHVGFVGHHDVHALIQPAAKPRFARDFVARGSRSC